MKKLNYGQFQKDEKRLFYKGGNNKDFHKKKHFHRVQQEAVPKQQQTIRSTSQKAQKNTAFFGEVGRKISINKRGFLQTPKKRITNSFQNSYKSTQVSTTTFEYFKKYKLYFGKKAWHFDKAAPIPGGNHKLSTGFVRKNKYYKKIFRAYQFLKKYYTFNKKAMIKAYRKRNSSRRMSFAQMNSSVDFAILTQMDSLYNSTMCKIGFIQNPKQKRTTKDFLLNGKAVQRSAQKKNFVQFQRNNRSSSAVQKDGDFCIRKAKSCNNLFIDLFSFDFFLILKIPLGD